MTLAEILIFMHSAKITEKCDIVPLIEQSTELAIKRNDSQSGDSDIEHAKPRSFCTP